MHEEEIIIAPRHEIADELLNLPCVVVVVDVDPHDVDGIVRTRERLQERRHNPIERRLDVARHPVVQLRKSRELLSIVLLVRPIHVEPPKKRRFNLALVVTICSVTPLAIRRHDLLNGLLGQRLKAYALVCCALCRTHHRQPVLCHSLASLHAARLGRSTHAPRLPILGVVRLPHGQSKRQRQCIRFIRRR